ncbi:MAG: type II toxin-antitoxin system VapC family toxin [Sulfurisoma sp.]|nr:type II toxin-antitoxin system VapC family toxin [Sulfurisoma sp.]
MIPIDTDVLIDFSRGDTRALNAIAAIEKSEPAAISTITVLEFLQGTRDAREWTACSRTLLRFEHAPLTIPVSSLAPALFKAYRLSHGLALADCLIAATALASNIPLLTGNQRDFRFIDGLELMAWPEPATP